MIPTNTASRSSPVQALSADTTARNERTLDVGYLWRISLTAAMGGFLFGYDWVVIGGAKPFFEAYFSLSSEAARGWANSCAVVGCLVGSAISGACSDRFGRRRLLLLAGILFAVSSVLTGWAPSFQMFVIWRMVGGIAIGLASNISPMYIAEITPADLRGRMVSINQLTIVLGVLGAQLTNWLIASGMPEHASVAMIRESWNGQTGWRWMFTAVTIPALAFFVGSLWVPESPRWLVRMGRAGDARKILARIGGSQYAVAESAEIEMALRNETDQQFHIRMLLVPAVRRVLMIGVVLAVLQQWSGINTILAYGEEMFREAGYGIGNVLFYILVTGIVLVVFTLIAIVTVDRFGRRSLMLIGCGGIGLFHLIISICYRQGLTGTAVLLPMLGAVGCYAFSLAPITWVLISEIFPNRIRGQAMSIAVSALWIACFVLIYTFPFMQRSLGVSKTFGVYSAICWAGFLFILRRVPETKGKSLEQIEMRLMGNGAQP